MFFNNKAVVLKINELNKFIVGMRSAGREHRDTRHGTNAVKSIFVETDNAFESVIFKNLRLNKFIVLRLANHRRNRDNHGGATVTSD